MRMLVGMVFRCKLLLDPGNIMGRKELMMGQGKVGRRKQRFHPRCPRSIRGTGYHWKYSITGDATVGERMTERAGFIVS